MRVTARGSIHGHSGVWTRPGCQEYLRKAQAEKFRDEISELQAIPVEKYTAQAIRVSSTVVRYRP
jgi:hypothetical protein